VTARPAVLTAALTGPIATKNDNPHLPTTPEEIAAAATGAYQAGAAVVHVHLRDAQGLPTADLAVARRTVELIQAASPVLVQLSTGVGLDVSYEDRERLVELRPRMATLNVCTMSFGRGEFRNPPDGVRRLAARMRELGIRPELEIYDSGHLEVVHTLIAEDLLEVPIACSLVLGVQGGMSATPENLIHLIGRLPKQAVWQVIAIGRDNLPMTAIGLAMGGNARTGMEDTLWLRRGCRAQSNAELVARLATLTAAIGRERATVNDAAVQLGLTAVT
jgi:3-keto-5-aminohexanoate cleavage enzyme